MSQQKKICVISNTSQIIDTIRINILSESVLFKVEFQELENPYYDMVDLKSEKLKNDFRKYNLIIIFDRNLQLNNNTEYYEAGLEKIFLSHRKKILLVVGNKKNSINIINSNFQIINSIDFHRGKNGLRAIELLLDFPFEIENTEIIASKPFSDDDEMKSDKRATKTIDSDKIKLSDRLRTSHYFSNKMDFVSWHIPHDEDVTVNFEESSDKYLDKDYKYINTVKDFYNVYTNKQRCTYFLIGHRGSGKSCFLRYFYEQYYANDFPKEPYIIVDFLRFGYIPNDQNLKYNILKALYKHFRAKKIDALIQKYRVIDHLFSDEEVDWVINYYVNLNNKYIVPDVLPGSLRYSIKGEIGNNGKLSIGREIIEKHEHRKASSFSDNEVLDIYKQYSEDPSLQWQWLKYLWIYICSYSKDKPLKFFASSMFDNAFFKSYKEFGANFDLYRNNTTLQNWKNTHLKEGLIKLSTCDEDQIEALLNSFIQVVANEYGVIHIVLDNMDQLDASKADFDIYNKISMKIHSYWPKVRFSVSIRPSTIDTIKEDTVAYKKFWLHTIQLNKVIEKSIQILLEDPEINRSETNFLENLLKIISYPVSSSSTKIDDSFTLTRLISDVCGNNLREGKELFSEIVDNWYQLFNKYDGFGFLRQSNAKNDNSIVYIAEHSALRSLFLVSDKNYKFKNHLINIFNTPGLNSYKRVLIQLRVIEILSIKKKLYVKDFWDTIQLLGYEDDEIQLAIYNLKIHRLISIHPFHSVLKPNETGKETFIFIRHRGNTYMSLIKKLSYIQMIYFMTELPSQYRDRFSYPNLPKTNELKKLCFNFLNSMWLYIKKELNDTTSTGLETYSDNIRNPYQLHNDFCEIISDVENINLRKLSKR